MHTRPLAFLSGLLILAVAALPGRGAEPRVTLKLTHVTCVQALRELEKASGVSLTLSPTPPLPLNGEPAPPAPKPDEPADFHWANVTLSAALQDLARHYQLQTAGMAGGFRLSAAPEPVRPLALAGLTTKAGLRFGVQQVQVQRDRDGSGAGASMSVTLRIDAEDPADLEKVWSLQDFTARDDRGTVLVARRWAHQFAQDTPTSAWMQVQFPAPHPAATRLDWLECNLLLSPRVTRAHVEARLPLPEGGFTSEESGLRVGFSHFEPGETLKSEPTSSAEVRYAQDHAAELQGTLTAPGEGRLDSRFDSSNLPCVDLIGASGKRYSPWGRSGKIAHPAGGPLKYELTWSYYAAAEPLVGISADLRHKEPPGGPIAFRLHAIPLPRTPGVAAGPYPAGQALTPASPLFAEGGATLVTPVLLFGKPASGGRVTLRLSPLDASTGEWLIAEVDASGQARIEPIKPGKYRVLRFYTPPAGQKPAAGFWLGADLSIDVAAGKQMVLSTLALGAAPGTPRATRDNPGQASCRIVKSEIQMRSQQLLAFTQPPQEHSQPFASLHLNGELAPELRKRLTSIRHLVGADDTGQLITGIGSINEAGLLWTSVTSLTGLRGNAKRLAWLEGDIVGWARLDPVPITLSAADLRQPFRKSFGEVTVELREFHFEGDPTKPAPVGGPTLRAVITSPPNTLLSEEDRNQIRPVLMGASGKSYPYRGSGEIGGNGTRCELNGAFERMSEPVASIRFDLLLRSGYERVASFRLTNLPIPAEPGMPFPEQLPQAKKLGRDHPLYSEKGGTLVAPVKLLGKPASGGRLSIGFAVKGGPIRWVEADVLADGLVTLEPLKPGTYHVLRLYQPDAKPAELGRGRWLHGEETVTVIAGKRAALPALEWVPAGVNPQRGNHN